MTISEPTILIVEDDPNDIFFLKYALETAGVTNPLQVVNDGQEAINYLSGLGVYADRVRFPFPALVFLDLKLPVRMGLDVLNWIKGQGQMQRLLVIVLTSSSEIKDLEEAYTLGARSYLVKPFTVGERLEMAKAIKKYWLDYNLFPAPINP